MSADDWKLVREHVAGSRLGNADLALVALERLEAEIRADEAEQVARLVMERCLNKVTGAALAGVIRSERVLSLEAKP